MVVAGGPSVTGVDGGQLHGTRTILVNHINFLPEGASFRRLAVAGAILDEQLLLERLVQIVKSGYPYFTGNTSCDTDALIDYLNRLNVYRVPTNHTEGIGDTFSRCVNGGHSGYFAVQLAVILGFRTIGLLGIDGNVPNQPPHFHDEYVRPGASPVPPRDQWCTELDSMAPLFRAMGLAIYNLSAMSMLQAFPKISISQWNSVVHADGGEVAHSQGEGGWGGQGTLVLPYAAQRYADRSGQSPTCFGGARNDTDPLRYRPVPSTFEPSLRQNGAGSILAGRVLYGAEIPVAREHPPLRPELLSVDASLDSSATTWLHTLRERYSDSGLCWDLSRSGPSLGEHDRYALCVASVRYTSVSEVLTFVGSLPECILAVGVLVDLGLDGEVDLRAEQCLALVSSVVSICEYCRPSGRYMGIHILTDAASRGCLARARSTNA